jgi:hypothetical protein
MGITFGITGTVFLRVLCRNTGSLQMKEYSERLHTELIKAQLRAQLYEGICSDIGDTSLVSRRGKRTRLICVYDANRLRDTVGLYEGDFCR